MRDLSLFLVVFGALPFIVKRPALGVMPFAWLSLMNPRRRTDISAGQLALCRRTLAQPAAVCYA